MKRLLLASVASILILIGLLTFRRELLALAMPWLVYLGAGLLFRPAALRLSASRRLSVERIRAGEPLVVTLEIANHGPAIEALLLEDALPPGFKLLDGALRYVAPLAAGAS